MQKWMSWNDTVSVVLNARGREIFEAHYKQLGYPTTAPIVLTDQLWHIAVVFGSHLSDPKSVPFESTAIDLVESVGNL